MQTDNWHVVDDKSLVHNVPVPAPAEVEGGTNSTIELIRAQQHGMNWRLQRLEERDNETFCCVLQ